VIFISYRREDTSGYARALFGPLDGRYRGKVFMDVAHLDLSVDFTNTIEKALDSCKFFIALIGPGWLTARSANGELRLHEPNDFVRKEIKAALDLGIPVIPLLVGGAKMPDPGQLPEDIRALARFQARSLSDQDWDYNIGVLIAHIEKNRPNPLRKLRRIAAAGALVALISGSGYWLLHSRVPAQTTIVDDDPPPPKGFQPLPQPSGPAPYRLKLSDVIQTGSIEQAGKIVFHTVGDTGGVKQPEFQEAVANAMVQDLQVARDDRPSFLYLLGDLIYFDGEASQYGPQFYQPYAHYSNPIFAIPGNHDGIVAAGSAAPSLSAFLMNFCARRSVPAPQNPAGIRKTMTQPNVYWTLITPFATIIGLYTNVPDGGEVRKPQRVWLAGEMRDAPKDRALILALHHPVYSLDGEYEGNANMSDLLDRAMAETGRIPDLVLSAHVNNYQRFTRTYNVHQVPYLVVGAGGYFHFYKMKQINGARITVPYVPEPGRVLNKYCDERHGYLRVTASREKLTGEYFVMPPPGHSSAMGAQKFDEFEVDLRTHRVETVSQN
jgi:hypothetical protein